MRAACVKMRKLGGGRNVVLGFFLVMFLAGVARADYSYVPKLPEELEGLSPVVEFTVWFDVRGKNPEKEVSSNNPKNGWSLKESDNQNVSVKDVSVTKEVYSGQDQLYASFNSSGFDIDYVGIITSSQNQRDVPYRSFYIAADEADFEKVSLNADTRYSGYYAGDSYVSLVDFEDVNTITFRFMVMSSYPVGANTDIGAEYHFVLYGSAKSETPEPATMLIFGIGLTGIGAVAARQRYKGQRKSAVKPRG